MTAYSNLPPQAVLPLGAYRVEDLEREARRAGHRMLHADFSAACDEAAVLKALGRDFDLPRHQVERMEALRDCLLALKSPADVERPGFLFVLRELPDTPSFDATHRNALLDVFRDGADHFFDHGTVFRVFYSVRKPAQASPAERPPPA
jgi:hypothetical protein